VGREGGGDAEEGGTHRAKGKVQGKWMGGLREEGSQPQLRCSLGAASGSWKVGTGEVACLLRQRLGSSVSMEKVGRALCSFPPPVWSPPSLGLL
jgi:hypothetical protein